MKNKKYTIKYSNEIKLSNSHPLIKTSIRKALATCLTFSLVVSGIGYAQALNKTGEDNVSKLNETEISSPHYIAIENFKTQKENYWDLSKIGNISPDRIFYVDISKMVENNDEPIYNFFRHERTVFWKPKFKT